MSEDAEDVADLAPEEVIMEDAVDMAASVARSERKGVLLDDHHYFEEDEEYYDAEGYTTARSLRSRGENTTGGLTTFLEPRVTQRVLKELEQARDFVLANRTDDDIEDEAWDTSMVAEYGDDIFEYMHKLEVR